MFDIYGIVSRDLGFAVHVCCYLCFTCKADDSIPKVQCAHAHDAKQNHWDPNPIFSFFPMSLRPSVAIRWIRVFKGLLHQA